LVLVQPKAKFCNFYIFSYDANDFLKEKLGYKGKNPAGLEGKMPISRKVLAKKVGYKARKWGFSSCSQFFIYGLASWFDQLTLACLYD